MNEKSILIAEDETIVSMDLKKFLQVNNYKVLSSVMSGEELVSQFLLKKPDLVIVDLRLKGKLSGEDAIRQLRKIDNTPVLVVSSAPKSDLKKLSRKIPNVRVLAKPYKESSLLELVNGFFN